MMKPVAIAILLFATGAATTPAQVNPATLLARDSHQGVVAAAEPRLDAAWYKEQFGKKNPYRSGLVAIEVYFRNDNEYPIQFDLSTARLILSPPGLERLRLEMLGTEDAVARTLEKDSPEPGVSRRPFPLPGGRPRYGRSKDWKKLEEKIQVASFGTDVVAPHASVHGIVFFDMNHHFDWLEHARLYLPDVQFMHNKKPLLYFEIDLAPAVRRN